MDLVYLLEEARVLEDTAEVLDVAAAVLEEAEVLEKAAMDPLDCNLWRWCVVLEVDAEAGPLSSAEAVSLWPFPAPAVAAEVAAAVGLSAANRPLSTDHDVSRQLVKRQQLPWWPARRTLPR